MIDVGGAVTGGVSIVALVNGDNNGIFPGSAGRMLLARRNEVV